MMDAVTLGMAKSAGRKDAVASEASNIATRTIAGRMGSFDNTTAKTFQLTIETVLPFDAVRLVLASNDRTNSVTVASLAASSPPTLADFNNSAGAWVAGGRQGQAGLAVPVAPHGTDRPVFAYTDWLPIASSDRTDGGEHPLLTVRAFVDSNAALPVIGDGSDDFTNWASRTDRRMFAMRYQDGDQIAAPSGFTSTTNRSQSPIVGVQYLTRGQVITVGAVGDSITEGRGTYLGEGFVFPALEDLNAAGGPVRYEYMNLGWSGQTYDRIAERAIDVMESEAKPDVIVIPAGSPNPVADGALTDAAVSAIRTRRSRIVAAARQNDVVPVVWTWLPTNAAVRAYGSSDAKRVAYNTEVLDSASRNLLVADTAPVVSGSTSGGQVQMSAGSQTDGIHPNTAGNTLLADVIKPSVVAAARRFNGGRRRGYNTRSDAPVFSTSVTPLAISGSGVWVYRGGSAGAWTLPPLNPGRQDSQVITIKARASSGGITVSRNGSDAINIGGAAGSSVTVKPGQTVTFVPSGNGNWDVLGLDYADFAAVKSDATTALTLDKSASVYVFTGTSATTWTLPATRSTGQRYTIKNIGSASITLQRAGASDQIYDTSASTSITIAAGASRQVIWSGSTYWLAI